MSELRWTLLILGVVFIAALSWWERRRPRQAFSPRLRDASPERGADEGAAQGAEPSASGLAQYREPWIGETELSDAVLPEVALTDAVDAQDRPGGSAGGAGKRPLEELPTLVIPDEDERLALQAAWDAAPPEPKLIDPEAGVGLEPSDAVRPEHAPGLAEVEIAGAEGVGAARVVEAFAGHDGAGSAEPPTVEWPPEESRRVVALRLVAAQPDRFPGRALRLALAAEGFLLGKFSVFHKPDESNRAVLSAASLTSPGAFDLETMDSQRYAGLTLFAVLPGPRTPPEAFEELLAAARNLNERLQGALQDERGGPLTPLRVASIRESLRAEAAAHET